MKKNIPTWGIIAIIFIAAIFLQKNIYFNSDVQWLSIAASRLLAGGDYFPHFWETNPPLILYIYILPVLMSQKFAISYSITVRAELLLFILFSLILSQQILKKIFRAQQANLLSGIVISLALIYLIFPLHSFAQREHLILVLTMPYVFLIAGGCENIPYSKVLRIVVAASAAIGFAIKPYFLPTLLLLELYYSYRQQRWWAWLRLETVWIAIVFLAYGMSIIIFTPDYLTIILPFIWHYYIPYYDYGKTSFLLLFANGFSFTVLAAFLFSYRLRNSGNRTLLVVLNITLLGFLIAYLWQKRAWYYHLLPMFSLAFLILINLVITTWQQWQQEKTTNGKKLLIMFFLTVVLLFFPIKQVVSRMKDWLYQTNNNYSPWNQLAQFINSHAAGKNMVVFSAHLGFIYTVAEHTKAHLLSPFEQYWMLPGIDALSQQQRLSSVEKKQVAADKNIFVAAVVKEFIQQQPALVLMDKDFNYIDLFSQSVAFRQAWRNYHLIPSPFALQVYARSSERVNQCGKNFDQQNECL